MAIERAIVIAKMRGAFREGMSASRFLQQMRVEGLSYRRTDMLGYWRSVNKIERVAGALRYVRKDRMPSRLVVADVTWNLKKEFMYVMKVKTRLSPGEPILERKVNIVTDKALTTQQMEQEVEARWGEWEKYASQELISVQAFTAVRKAR